MRGKTNSDAISRRGFVGGVAIGTFAVAIGCGDDDVAPGDDAGMVGNDGGGTVDSGTVVPGAPVWMTVPTIQFVQGVASTFSIAPYVSDPDGDDLTIMLNAVALPAGVTYEAAAMQFVYDGSGPVGMTSGHVLTADDGTA